MYSVYCVILQYYPYTVDDIAQYGILHNNFDRIEAT